MGALRVTICEFIGISCYNRASVSKARPTTHQKKEAALESEWFSMKGFGNMLAPSSRSAVDLYCCRRWLKMILWEWTSQLDLFQANFLRCTMYVNILQEKNTWEAQQAIHHTPTIWSERALASFSYYQQTSTNMHPAHIGSHLKISLDSHSSHTQQKIFPKVPRGQWVSEFPSTNLQVPAVGERTQLGDFLLKGPVKGRFS